MNSITLQDELSRNPDLRNEQVKILQEWLVKQCHLPKFRDSDLVVFLHSNYCCIETTKIHIENYCSMRTHLPEIFLNRDPVKSDALKKAFDTVMIVPLAKRLKEGYKVIVARLIDTDAINYNFDDAVKYLNMILDVCIYEEGTSSGYIFVFDINGANIKHSTRLSWMSLKKFFDYLQKGAPCRWKGLHYINTSKIIDKVQDFVKTKIVDAKFADKLYFHSSLDTVSEILPLEILPSEMGGKAGPMLSLHRAEVKKLESYRDWFLKMDSRFWVDESKRSGMRLSARDIFGPESEFKNLQID